MSELTCVRFKTMLAAAVADVGQRADEFSALDAATGDGDHGTAIVGALAAAHGAAPPEAPLKSTLNDMAFAAMSQSCGSTSTLIGAWLMGMSDGIQQEPLDAPATAAMFAAGLAGVQLQTKADLGDKTLLDALIPATAAMQAHTSGCIAEMLAAAAAAAAQGAAGTTQMIARFGRARNLGDRTLGHADPGAMSMACILGAFARSF